MSHLSCCILTLLFEGDRRLARLDKRHSWDCSHFVFTRLCHSLYVPSHMVHWCQAWCPNRCSNTFGLKSPPPCRSAHQLGWNCRNFSRFSDINLGAVASNLTPWAKAETDFCHVFGCNGIRIIFLIAVWDNDVCVAAWQKSHRPVVNGGISTDFTKCVPEIKL